jgi:polar amino acid transport system permease protein
MEHWDWQVAWDISPTLLRGLWVTIQLTLLGTALAMVLGLVLAVLRRSRLRLLSWPTAFVVEFIRSTPFVVQVFFVFFLLPQYNPDLALSAFATGVIGLGIHYATYTSEVYRAGIESVARGQWEASTALSLNAYQTWLRVILPQAIPRVIPALGNYLVAMFKDAPIVATIGLLDVLGEARRIASRDFLFLEPYTLVGVYFLAVSVPAAIFVRFLEGRFGRPVA